ncbi:MAG: GntR family transcriptional regulator [Polaromonas sp.]|uniref:GntR family transcriptional regulator n=1 Tax=Polaromonas sp. TaxID=1869339 RepID=UPI0025E6DAB2|nr:GntR family transcriptional regulator [Polaromonas sp.]MBI2726284.1 GntR family transcriptional regulator [Polaromonas sp.]
MASQISVVVDGLKRRILAGTYAPGERLVELQVVDELGVSRTPIRLAFEELERQGFLERLPTRGFRVRGISPDDIADAIDVRGNLEGMAARLLAQRGAGDGVIEELQMCVREGRELLREAKGNRHLIDASRWVPMNGKFHSILVAAAGNQVLQAAIDLVGKNPLAGPASLTLSGDFPQLEFKLIERAQEDHEDVLAGIVARDGALVELLMKEHARRSRDNKRRLLEGVRQVMQDRHVA